MLSSASARAASLWAAGRGTAFLRSGAPPGSEQRFGPIGRGTNRNHLAHTRLLSGGFEDCDPRGFQERLRLASGQRDVAQLQGARLEVCERNRPLGPAPLEIGQ